MVTRDDAVAGADGSRAGDRHSDDVPAAGDSPSNSPTDSPGGDPGVNPWGGAAVEGPDDHVQVVTRAHDGMRLDKALAALTGRSRSKVATAIDEGRVTIGDATPSRSRRVCTGDEIRVSPPAPATSTPPPELPRLLHDDQHLAVVDKPAGMVVHPGHGNPDGTLADALRAHGIDAGPDPERPGIVHRLDRDTSGVMVVARTDHAHRQLVTALAQRTVTRLYLVLVENVLPGSHGVVDVPLGRDERHRTRFAARSDGRHAVTHFARVAGGQAAVHDAGHRRVELVACRLDTGRTHQIRVHMAHMGCPVVGDATYGASDRLAEVLGLQRMWLHAARLCFVHPATDDNLDVAAPLPADLIGALEHSGIVLPDEIAWP